MLPVATEMVYEQEERDVYVTSPLLLLHRVSVTIGTHNIKPDFGLLRQMMMWESRLTYSEDIDVTRVKHVPTWV